MSYKPPYVVADFETEENGEGSTETYRPNFRVSSAAFSWRSEDGAIKSEFILGENAVFYFLERIVSASIAIVAHNAQFEMAVIKCRYVELAAKIKWFADTMRLVQVFDNGGDPDAFEYVQTLDDQIEAFADEGERDDGREAKKPKGVPTAGLGLVKACKRILGVEDHKKEAHDWLRENVPEARKGRVGKHLGKLPPDMLERYNIGDTENTLLLCEHIVSYFKEISYDWMFDHRFFFASCERIVDAKIEGVDVDRESLQKYALEVESEIRGLGEAFLERFAEPIRSVECRKLYQRLLKFATIGGREKYLKRLCVADDLYLKEIRFKVGSNKQLAALFCDRLGMSARFVTAKGAPSFRSAVLGQWGDGGEMLKLRRKRLLVLKQAQALLELSVLDNKWHLDIKAAGTATGRHAGGQH